MTPEETLSLAALVVAGTQISKWAGIPDQRGPIVVLGFSLLGVLFWTWSGGPFVRADARSYVAAFINVALTAAGSYGFTRSGPSAITATKEPPSGAGSSPTVVEFPVRGVKAPD